MTLVDADTGEVAPSAWILDRKPTPQEFAAIADEVVADEAVAAREKAEAAEADASPSRWEEADRYAVLAARGWTQTRIAQRCGVSQQAVSVFVRASTRYPVDAERPTFWTAYAGVTGEKEKKSKADSELVQQSLTNEWYTPAKYIQAARFVLDGIDLDPASCAEANEVVKAKRFFTKEDDGLAHDWRGAVWLNPPYGRDAEGSSGEFVAHLISEFAAGRTTAAVALVNAHCTDTKWFQPLWGHTLCFTDHRVNFAKGTEERSGSTHGSVFVYLGDDPKLFADSFAQFGAVVRRWAA